MGKMRERDWPGEPRKGCGAMALGLFALAAVGVSLLVAGATELVQAVL